MSPSTHVQDVQHSASDPSLCENCGKVQADHLRLVSDGAKRDTDRWLCPTAIFTPTDQQASVHDLTEADTAAEKRFAPPKDLSPKPEDKPHQNTAPGGSAVERVVASEAAEAAKRAAPAEAPVDTTRETAEAGAHGRPAPKPDTQGDRKTDKPSKK